MLVLPWSKLAILATCLAACIPPTAAKDAQTVIAGMDDLRRSVETAQSLFENYDGGMVPSLTLGRAIWDVYSQTKHARADWDAAPPFKDDEVPDILKTYHAMRVSIGDAIQKAGSKGPAYDKAGFRLLAIGMMQVFENERSSFQQAARSKIPERYHGDIAGPVASLKDEFQVAMRALG